ncbi:unnamed protein product [Allacma fusca]|uniref:Uncharacterized protein n=1 Tax=Allacma fusca TaxID=39272 RepID=A0A8J2J1D5_9HEXA|nr:unnamed protein product [Allacma fusca]
MKPLITLFCLVWFCPKIRAKNFIDGENVNKIASDLKHCVLIIFQFTKPIDYSEITIPFVLHVFHGKPYNVGARYNSQSFKEKVLRCYAAFVFFESHESIQESKCSSAVKYTEFYCAENQRADLLRWWVNDAMSSQNIHFHLTIVFRQDSTPSEFFSLILDYLHIAVPGNIVFVIFPRFLQTDESLYKNDTAQLITDVNVTDTADTFNGYLIFSQGPKYNFNCRPSECYKKMWSTFDGVTNYGRKIVWQISVFPDERAQKSGLKFGSPFQREAPWNITSTIYEFLVSDLEHNFTGGFTTPADPSIALDLAHFNAPLPLAQHWYREFPVSYSTSHFFITSDNVVTVTLEFQMYATPFDVPCWMGIASVVLLMGTILSSSFLSPGRTKFWKKLPSTLLSVFESLIDQGMNIPKDGSNLSNNASQNCLRECIVNEDTFGCSNNNEQFKLDRNYSKTIDPNQFQAFCESSLESIILTKLTLPQTALVVPSDEFEYYWDTVRLSIKGTNFKFSHNRYSGNDQLLRSTTSVYIASYFDDKYHYVAKRIQIMLSAGLYLLWEKWDKIRFPMCHSGYRSKASHENGVRALSMESSLILACMRFYGVY